MVKHALLLLVLLLSSLTQLAALPQADEHANMKCLTVYFLAYVKQSHRGSVVEGKVCIEPSTSLSVSIKGAKYGPSVIDSFLIAIRTVARLCDPRAGKLRIIVSLPQGFYIKGASGSLLLALAVLKLLGWNIPGKPLSATGVVSIDGFVDPVGAVPYKLDAARRHGVKLVYVPLLNYAEAHNVTGIRVRYVDTLLNICRPGLATGNSTALTINSSILYKLYRVFLHDSREFLLKAESYYSMLPSSAKERFGKYYREMLRAINRTLEAHHYYSSASLSFSLYITVLGKYLESSNVSFLQRLVDAATRRANHVYEEIAHSKVLSVDAVPYLIVILDRIKDTIYYANMFENLTTLAVPSTSRFGTLVAIASYAYARSLTTETWFKVLEIVNSSSNDGYIPTKAALDISWRILDLVSRTIELSPSYSPLSFDAIAATRSYLASINNLTIATKVFRDLKALLRINLENLTPTQRVLPYLYALYGDDLRRYANGTVSTQILFYSLADLVASATINILQALNHSMRTNTTTTFTPSWKPSSAQMRTFIAAFTFVAVASSTSLLLLEVIEKRSRAS